MSRAPSYVPARKVISSVEMANIVQGSAYLEEARKYLESTAEKTQQEIEEARKRGYDKIWQNSLAFALKKLWVNLMSVN